MYVIGLSCSPRKEGNTDILVNQALKGAKGAEASTGFLRISDYAIAPCDGCESCHETGECRIDDDMQILYQKILKADGIILGSPVYFWSVSAQAKIFIDRTYALRYPSHRMKNKVCSGIVVAGRRGCMSAMETLNSFFLGQDMIPAGLGIAGYGNNKGDVLEDRKVMEDARSLGEQMVNLIKNMKKDL